MAKRFLVDLEDMEDEGIALSSLNKIEIVEYFLNSVSLMDKIVKKTRYFIPDSNGVISDLDIYERDNLAVLKLKSKDSKMFRPYWLGKEVTGDHRYEDDNLSFFGNPENGVVIKGPGILVYQTQINTKKINLEIAEKVIAKDYSLLPLKDKIELIYQEIYNYLIDKLKSLRFQDISDDVLTLDGLLLLFDSKFIFEEDKNDFFSPIIHYILEVIGDIQGSSISWGASDEYPEDPFLDKGKFNFNCNQFTELLVNYKTPSIKIVRYILDFFQNHFLEEYTMMLKLRNPKNNEEH